MKLNIIDDICVGVGTSDNTNVYNIDIGTTTSSNNSLGDNDFDECFRNTNVDENNEINFSLHDKPTNYLF